MLPRCRRLALVWAKPNATWAGLGAGSSASSPMPPPPAARAQRAASSSAAAALSASAPPDHQPASPSPGRVTFCVEGNISVGKSTFLREMAAHLGPLAEVVPEPLEMWQKVGGISGRNILDAFYRDPGRYAYTFQNYVFLTRFMQEARSRSGGAPLRLMERSVFSDRMVFVRAVSEARWMSDIELDIYDAWYGPVVAALPALVPDGFVYLRAAPATCLRRLQARAREEESSVDEAYLCSLHEKHEEWLHPAGVPGQVLAGARAAGRAFVTRSDCDCALPHAWLHPIRFRPARL